MQTTFILASLAGSALAGHVLNAAPILKRNLEALQPRQTGLPELPDISLEDAQACQSAALDLLSTLPTPGPKIQSDVINNPQTGDPCSFSTPASLSSEYASYSKELMSWFSSHEKDVKSAASACSQLASLGGDLVDVCSTDIPAIGGVEATKTSEKPSSETGASSNESKTEGGDSGSKTEGSDSSSKTEGSDSSSKTEASNSSNTSASGNQSSSTSTGGAPRATGMAIAGLAAGLVAAVL